MSSRTPKAIPEGYMTVGELAKKMDTTVRTLQYYDKQGILIPSGESVGGRRLYTDADLVQLHQIQSLKFLGFSLDDIRERLTHLETPADVADALQHQADTIRSQVAQLLEALDAVEKLREETLRMDKVDFALYADIVALLKMKNDRYWVVSQAGDKMLDRMRQLGALAADEESLRAAAREDDWSSLNELAMKYLADGVEPRSQEGQEFAARYWQMVTDFTGGDMSLLAELNDFESTSAHWQGDMKEAWQKAKPFIENALDHYFQQHGNPFLDA